jgi:molybdate transport system ATP-binding protein
VAPEQRQCGHVFQEYGLFPHLRAWQNVAYPLRDLPRRDRRRRALELLDRFGIAEFAEARPRTLSGGERQRVAVARALARRPAALLLDEPLSALDARTRASAGRELASVLRDTGVPTLLVTHDFIEAALLGDQIGVIDGGRVAQVGTAAELAASPASAFVADSPALSCSPAPPGRAPTSSPTSAWTGAAASSASSARRARRSQRLPLGDHLAPDGTRASGSTQNHLPVEVISVTAVGHRIRVGLAPPKPLTAEITDASAHQLALGPRHPRRRHLESHHHPSAQPMSPPAPALGLTFLVAGAAAWAAGPGTFTRRVLERGGRRAAARTQR